MKHSISYEPYSLEWFIRVDELCNEHKLALEDYAEKLLWWNRKVNLVSRDVSRETLMDHIKHSLTLSVLEGFKEAKKVLDTGTGGGLPGLPLAVAYPGKDFMLNDIVQKKISVVSQIKRELQLQNLKTKACSITELSVGEYDLIISKHAFKIRDLITHFGSNNWKEIILLKGKDFEDELDGLSEELSIQVFDLFEESRIPFYNGKAVLSIKKKEFNEE